jgi:hypothetical protein
MAQRTRVETGESVTGWWSERENSAAVSWTIPAMVFIASLEYAWYSKRVTVFPALRIDYDEFRVDRSSNIKPLKELRVVPVFL